MWGKGYVQPADAALSDMLITPLGLNKDLSILDLSAGLGERLRKTAEKYGVYITGLEPDAQIAARGMEMSIIEGKGKRAAIAAYDPASFSLTKSYDCIIARETFYRVANRRKFFVELSACAKPKAQLSFTDYIVNPEDREKSAIKKWIAFEPGANPASLVEIAEDWAKAGFNLRVHDDQTALYVKEVAEGVKRLAVFLAKGAKPDAETRAALRRRVETWALRLVALDQGMKFYRFYGLKQ
jgi:cyclopropane fatty-acyl-phospholipid synthase-like methyltransferase